MPDRRVLNRRYGRTRRQSPPHGRIDGSPRRVDLGTVGDGDVPLDAETGSACGRVTDLVRLAYRTCVYPSKDLVIGSVMIARR
jgi:hypothetical protein